LTSRSCVIVSCISTGRDSQWDEGDIDEKSMIGRDVVGRNKSCSRRDEEYLYMYV
jgi:hypothetical protein